VVHRRVLPEVRSAEYTAIYFDLKGYISQ
jgi:hypothetical protein